MHKPKKSMGQHWLKDTDTLAAICQAANLSKDDFVLEIGPGLGDLTRQLIKIAGQVLAVSSKLFQPPPKVDSQVIILTRRPKPLFKDLDTKLFFRVVKAGFAGRRKKLRSSLAAGLSIDKTQADNLLKAAGVSGELRA